TPLTHSFSFSFRSSHKDFIPIFQKDTIVKPDGEKMLKPSPTDHIFFPISVYGGSPFEGFRQFSLSHDLLHKLRTIGPIRTIGVPFWVILILHALRIEMHNIPDKLFGQRLVQGQLNGSYRCFERSEPIRKSFNSS